jgi:hypothetical protein
VDVAALTALLSVPGTTQKRKKLISRASFPFRRFRKTGKTAQKNAFQKTPETPKDP